MDIPMSSAVTTVPRVTDEMVENALLQIFVDCGIEAGDSLPFRRLRADWPRTRLRRNDLVQAVKRLVFQGDLELEDDHEGGLFILTPAGHRRAASLPPTARNTWSQFVARALQSFTRTEPARPARVKSGAAAKVRKLPELKVTPRRSP